MSLKLYLTAKWNKYEPMPTDPRDGASTIALYTELDAERDQQPMIVVDC